MENLPPAMPKIELKDILSFNFHTENLQKYLDFFSKTDNFIKREVNDLKIRMDRVEENQKLTAEIFFRLNVNEKKIDDIYRSINAFQAKFIDIDYKISQIDEVKIILYNYDFNFQLLCDILLF